METTNPAATVQGLCPLLQAQELSSRPRNKQSRAIGLDDAASVSTVRGSPPIPYRTPWATRNGDPWPALGFPVRCNFFVSRSRSVVDCAHIQAFVCVECVQCVRAVWRVVCCVYLLVCVVCVCVCCLCVQHARVLPVHTEAF